MDPRLLRYYNQELRHLREMGGEFAKTFPKVAGRLGMEGLDCADPYVERLIESYAFLAARVQLKIDAEFPRFTQNLLEMIYPHYLAPTPSMTVVHCQPDLAEGTLAMGFVLPRGSILRSRLGKGEQTPCEYRTAHDVTLWPLEIAQVEYFTYAGDVPKVAGPGLPEAKAGLRFRLRTTAGLTFDKVALDSLSLYLRGVGALPTTIYEQLFAHSVAMVVMPTTRPASWHEIVDKAAIRRVGFDDEQALLPKSSRSFSGYRLLHEYFAFPERYLFVELTGLGAAMRRCTDNELDVVVLLDRNEPAFEAAIDASQFALFCTPAINLFPKRADRIHLTERASEYHLIPDRSRPMDFEVYQVNSVDGIGSRADQQRVFMPFYAANDMTSESEDQAYYAVQRTPRLRSLRQRRKGARSSYIGSEVFLSLVDAAEAPYSSDLRQLAVTALCTNRDLPLQMPVGQGDTDFTLEVGAPIQTIRCISGPTAPKPSFAEGETAWRLVSHLSLNYLSLSDNGEKEGAAALRELLTLYGDVSDATIRKQIEGVKSVTTHPAVRRIPLPGPTAYGRGLEVSVTFDEAAFEGRGCFILGSVLEEFFRRYVSINSFTETVLKSVERGEIMRWPVKIGRRQML